MVSLLWMSTWSKRVHSCNRKNYAVPSKFTMMDFKSLDEVSIQSTTCSRGRGGSNDNVQASTCCIVAMLLLVMRFPIVTQSGLMKFELQCCQVHRWHYQLGVTV